jgi:hypothetical protein
MYPRPKHFHISCCHHESFYHLRLRFSAKIAVFCGFLDGIPPQALKPHFSLPLRIFFFVHNINVINNDVKAFWQENRVKLNFESVLKMHCALIVQFSFEAHCFPIQLERQIGRSEEANTNEKKNCKRESNSNF